MRESQQKTRRNIFEALLHFCIGAATAIRNLLEVGHHFFNRLVNAILYSFTKCSISPFPDDKYVLQEKYINCGAINSSEKWLYKPRQILRSWLKQNIAPPRQ